jgi:hypothetical protein
MNNKILIKLNSLGYLSHKSLFASKQKHGKQGVAGKQGGSKEAREGSKGTFFLLPLVLKKLAREARGSKGTFFLLPLVLKKLARKVYPHSWPMIFLL